MSTDQQPETETPEPGMPQVGDRVGAYEIVRVIGRGGMAMVYEALQPMIERRAAIKVLFPFYSSQEHWARRFVNEARAANRVRHPGLMEIYEFGQLPSGCAYIVMEYLQGEALDYRMAKRGRYLPQEALAIAKQMADALSVAHDAGIIHRDLKPANIMLVPDPEHREKERVKVLDFGIAKLHGGSAGNPAQRLTETGTTIGTPEYMSPEQCKGQPNLDGKADVFSLGVILYEMLSQRLPYDGKGALEQMTQHVHGSPTPLAQVVPATPVEVITFVDTLLARDPEARPTMAEVARRAQNLGDALTSASTRATVLISSPVQRPLPKEPPTNPMMSSTAKTNPSMNLSVSPQAPNPPKVPEAKQPDTLETPTSDRASRLQTLRGVALGGGVALVLLIVGLLVMKLLDKGS